MRDTWLRSIYTGIHIIRDRIARMVGDDGSIIVRPIGNDEVLPAIIPHRNDSYGEEMAVNGAFSGTPSIVYQENLGTPTEYNATAIVGTWDFASTDQNDTPSGQYSIDGTATQNGDIMELDNGVCPDCVAITGKIFITKWDEAKSNHLIMYAFDKTLGVPIGNEVHLEDYVNVNDVNVWQSAAIPLSEFGILAADMDAFRIRVVALDGEPNAADFYFDDIQLEEQGGGVAYRATPPPGTWFHVKYLKTIFKGIPTGFHTDGQHPLIDPDQLFNITKLPNGIVNIIKARGVTLQALSIRCLDDYNAIPEMGEPYTVGKAIDNTINFIYQLTFAEPLVLKYEDGDYSDLIINDNLEGLGSLKVKLGGYLEIRS